MSIIVAIISIAIGAFIAVYGGLAAAYTWSKNLWDERAKQGTIILSLFCFGLLGYGKLLLDDTLNSVTSIL